MYRRRHPVENFFCNLKQFSRIATRYGKTGKSLAAMIHLASAVLASRRLSTGPSRRPPSCPIYGLAVVDIDWTPVSAWT
jgi:hypothetical protein